MGFLSVRGVGGLLMRAQHTYSRVLLSRCDPAGRFEREPEPFELGFAIRHIVQFNVQYQQVFCQPLHYLWSVLSSRFSFAPG